MSGMKDETTIEEQLTFSNDSMNLEALFLGGIVFENPEEYDVGIPYNISYKLRYGQIQRRLINKYRCAVFRVQNCYGLFVSNLSNNPTKLISD